MKERRGVKKEGWKDGGIFFYASNLPIFQLCKQLNIFVFYVFSCARVNLMLYLIRYEKCQGFCKPNDYRESESTV